MTNATEWIGAVAAIVAILISVISYYQSNKALRFSSFTHKKDVAPKLIITYEISKALSFDDRQVYFRLENKNYGVAKVTRIISSGHFNPEVKIEKTITLKYNGYVDFDSSPTSMVYPVEQLNLRREMPTFLAELQTEITRVVFDSFFVVNYQDELKNKYQVTLKFINGHFEGDEREL